MGKAAPGGIGLIVRVLVILLMLAAGMPAPFDTGRHAAGGPLLDQSAHQFPIVELRAATPDRVARPERDLPQPPPVLIAAGAAATAGPATALGLLRSVSGPPALPQRHGPSRYARAPPAFT